jgi:alpha-tubulin suppressor-like RCC1 family protein
VNRRALRGLAALGAAVALAVPRGGPSQVRADTPPPLVDLWTFGRNRVGQLGSVPPNTTIPWPVHTVKRWVAVSAGTDHTLALTDRGEVFAWGDNESGQLGTGSTNGSMLPVPVPGLDGVTAIAAGGQHSLAYRESDHTLWGWGSNSQGQIAQPSAIAMSTTPARIALSAPLGALAAGGAHSLALDTNGVVYAWGENLLGQLGLGDVDGRFSPVAVPLAGPAIAIAAGSAHSLAVTSGDGQVWTWGWNVFGGLGNGGQGRPDEAFPNPTKAIGVTGVDQVSGGAFHSLARTTDGHVWAWGYNTEGQVGNGAVTPANTGVLTPVLLDGVEGVASVDAGSIHSIALATDGTVWTWGSNQFGAGGTNGRDDHLTPVRAYGGLHATAVSAGGSHTVLLGPPVAPLGLVQFGSPESADPPAALPDVKHLDGPDDVVALGAGARHGVAIDGEHRVWTWGDDSSGQLGTNDGTRAAPELVDLPLDGAAGFVEVAARANQSYALRSDGAVFAWGDGSYGQLGLGTTEGQAIPARVVALSRIVALGAGERHAIALDGDGSVWAWGQNLHGELGTSPSAKLQKTPLLVPGLTGTVFVAAGGFHSAAIDLVGTLSLWGEGSRGQLGTGGIVGGPSIVNAALPHGVTMASLGRFHTLVLRNGAVSAFGDASACQLGTGSIPGVWVPAPVLVPRDATLVRAGDYDGLAVTGTGEVYGWGDDSLGELGVGGPTFTHLS